MYYFYIQIIQLLEQEINKMAMHTHAIFRPRNAMFSLSNTYVFPDWQRWRHCYPLWLIQP